MRNPSADLVVVQLLRSLPELAETPVSNRLPRDEAGKADLSAWGTRLTYVSALTLQGDNDLGTGDGSAAYLVDCWARPQLEASKKVPWERAAAVAQTIESAAGSDIAWSTLLMPATYRDVLLDGMEISKPASVEEVPLRLARYQMTLRIHYAIKE